MDTALQIDLAKPEAPAEQVLGSVLGAASLLDRNTASSRPPSDDGFKESEKTIRGASRTTSQIRLKPKDQQSPSFRSADASKPAHFTLEDSDESVSHTLQPVDGGFGAWSYVASAFAMYIVVWGEPSKPKSSFSRGKD